MIIVDSSGEIYTMSMAELMNIIKDVIETADIRRFNSDDVELAIERTNKRFNNFKS